MLEKVMCFKGSMAYCGFKHGRMGATWNTGKERSEQSTATVGI